MAIERKMSQGAGQLDANASGGEDLAAAASESGGGAAMTANPDSPSLPIDLNQREQAVAPGESIDVATAAALEESDGTSDPGRAGLDNGASSSPVQSASVDRKSPSVSPYLVTEGTDQEIEHSEEGTTDGTTSKSSPAVDSPSQPTPAPVGGAGSKAGGRRVRSRRLSFADELGGPLSHVTYHSNLHYAQTEEPAKAIIQPGGPACECVCIIS